MCRFFYSKRISEYANMRICPSAERKSGNLSFLAFYENKMTGKSIFQAIILEEPLFVRRLHSLHVVSE